MHLQNFRNPRSCLYSNPIPFPGFLVKSPKNIGIFRGQSGQCVMNCMPSRFSHNNKFTKNEDDLVINPFILTTQLMVNTEVNMISASKCTNTRLMWHTQEVEAAHYMNWVQEEWVQPRQSVQHESEVRQANTSSASQLVKFGLVCQQG